MTNCPIEILLVYTHLRTGGIETLIIRMANWLTKEGHDVTVFLLESGELISLLDERVKVIISPTKYLFYIPFLGKGFLKKILDKKFTGIYSFGPEGCYIASFIYKYTSHMEKPIFLNGIYHPYEFALSGEISITGRMIINLYNNFINDSSKIFMSEEVRFGNEKILKRQMHQSLIWPLPIDESRFKNINRKIKPFRIVSIGRFAKFKTYNLYMINIIEELWEKGYDATWDVYGFGPLELQMRELINQKGLNNRIFIRGVLEYEKIASTLSTAHVFVGVGSALIEAGFCKVACVPAIADDLEGVTYGSLYELPYYSCGERVNNLSTVSVISAICRIFDMNVEDYNVEVEKTYKYVQAYSIDPIMKKFIEYIKNKTFSQRIEHYQGWRYFIFCVASYIQELRKKIAARTRVKRLYSNFLTK